MNSGVPSPIAALDEDAALRMIIEGTATATGERFFAALVEALAKALRVHAAMVTEYIPETRHARTLGFYVNPELLDTYEYPVENTPCEGVLEGVKFVHYPDDVINRFPKDKDLKTLQAASYMGVPLQDVDGRVMGHLAVLDKHPMPEEPRGIALFQIFAARAAAELQRIRAEEHVRERQQQLSRLVDGAMDAIVELDKSLNITLMNPAAEHVFDCTLSDSLGENLTKFLEPGSAKRLKRFVFSLATEPEGKRYMWIPGGLTARTASGREFPAEATLSRSDRNSNQFYTLILRDVNDRLEAEAKIRSLTEEAEYLREELNALHNFEAIAGKSDALLRALHDVDQVAPGDTTVLITGETGVGKELFARAIHATSARSEKPLIKVNCAAIPDALMESEFFGHEKGAFTGATAKREGRFALADGGTIFLDEIGELPLDLQVKLLRVLQEGEFEPVGSSQTRKVDVRVIAATNRNLADEVKAGRFRKDLYYRLNVFPVHVPPLRERGNDVVLLAEMFAERYAHQLGREVPALTATCRGRLLAYDWPGNVRELQNVIERAVITARGGTINLDRALPETANVVTDISKPCGENGDPDTILTADELTEFERRNIIRALEKTNWKVSGDKGAATLLHMKPSTLSSRMKALGISRPK